MLRLDRIVKVLDFGLAKLTERETPDMEAPTLVNTDAGVVMGTARYMSPEQVRGLAVDARTDVWSLGVVMRSLPANRCACGHANTPVHDFGGRQRISVAHSLHPPHRGPYMEID